MRDGVASRAEPADLARLRDDLGRWYDLWRRDLPWRRTTDPYAIWVSETMLQQTRVATVIPYYHRWLRRFPDAGRLAAADLQTVLKCWEGLGYYARARNFHRAAQIVAQRYDGRVPADPDAFGALPGVGPYIRAAVLSIAFDHPLAVVDGNVKRVLARWRRIEAPVNAADAHKVFAPLASRCLDADRPGRFNQAVMELGALVCTPRAPRCGDCPIGSGCRSKADGCQADYPRRAVRKKVPEHRMVVLVVRRNRRLLIVQRPVAGLLGGLWEFPALQVSGDRTPEDAALQETAAEAGIPVRVSGRIGRIRHAYTHFKVEAEVICGTWDGGGKGPGVAASHRWVTAGQLAEYPLTGVARKARALIAAGPDD